jgi:hypothetical protein
LMQEKKCFRCRQTGHMASSDKCPLFNAKAQAEKQERRSRWECVTHGLWYVSDCLIMRCVYYTDWIAGTRSGTLYVLGSHHIRNL